MARTQRLSDQNTQKIGARLIQALSDDFGLTMTQAAGELGYENATTLHKIRRGKALPDPARLAKFAREQKIRPLQTLNLHWILTGQGHSLIDRQASGAAPVKINTTDVDIINSLRQLAPEFKQAVRDLILTQTKKPRKRS